MNGFSRGNLGMAFCVLTKHLFMQNTSIMNMFCLSQLDDLQVQRISIEWEFYVSRQLQKRIQARGYSKELVSLSLLKQS